jgi:hypothetical protein
MQRYPATLRTSPNKADVLFINHHYDDHVKEEERGGQVACMGEKNNVYNIVLRQPEGKRPFRRPKCRWKGSITKDLKNRVSGCGLDSYGLGDGPVAGSCERDEEPSISVKRRVDQLNDSCYRHRRLFCV